MAWERERVAMASGWHYAPVRWRSRGPEPAWAAVELPHCWNRRDAFQQGVVYRQGWGSYHIAFDRPSCAAQGEWWLVTEGFYGWGQAWLNGRSLGHIDGEYLGLELRLAELQATGNELILTLCNRYRREVLPGQKMPDFLLYGGLSGRAWLEFRPAQGFMAFPRVRADYDPVTGTGRLRVTGQAPGDCFVTLGMGERDAPAGVKVRSDSQGHFSADLVRDDMTPWSCEQPQLYGVRVTLGDGDRVLDACSCHVGFRRFEWVSGEGLRLNGSPVRLRGVNRHESMPGMGRALPDSLHQFDAERIADMGLNFVRLAHYPQHSAFLDRCDELGILVYPEIASWKSVRGWGGWLRSARRQMRRIIERDGHRPGILLWGMGNESRSRRAFRLLAKDVATWDDRPVTYAENHLYRARRKHTLGLADVWGINYEFDEVPEALAASRLGVALVSECANAPHARRGDLEQELEQARRVVDAVERSHVPGVAGYALWCMNDYATLRKGRYLRYSGMLDAWREEKLAAWVLRALYRQDPVLHVELRCCGERLVALVAANVGAVRLSCCGGKWVQVVEPTPWCAVDLPGTSVELVAEAVGSAEGAVPVCVRGTLAPPVSVCISTQELGSGDMTRLTLAAQDAGGFPAVGWDGLATVATNGTGAFYREGMVRLDGGRGTLYVTPPPSGKLEVAAELVED